MIPRSGGRIRVVPFDVVIPEDEQDNELDDRLQLEADAVLTWAVRGWRQYQDGGLDAPAVVIAATDRYHRESHTVARFVEDRCLTGSPANKATTEQLFKAWEQWRRDDGAEEVSRKVFGRSLNKLAFRPASRGGTVNGSGRASRSWNWRPPNDFRPERLATCGNAETLRIARIFLFTLHVRADRSHTDKACDA